MLTEIINTDAPNDAMRQIIRDNEHLTKEIVVSIPVRPNDGVCIELATCISKWNYIGFYAAYIKDFMGGFIETMRQRMAYQFLKSYPNHKYLLMIDNDVAPPVELPFLLGRHDLPVVGGPTPIMSSKVGVCMNFTVKDKDGKWRFPSIQHTDKMPQGLIPVGHIGTGALLIRRDVLESFTWEGEDIPFYIPQHYRLDGAKKGELRRGEDIEFSSQVRKKGFDLYADTEACCGHKKQMMLTWPVDNLDPDLSPSVFRTHPDEYEIGD
jgi:hypothetical protein